MKDDTPISEIPTLEGCIYWLDAKYKRHGELEDQYAANFLRELLDLRVDRDALLKAIKGELYMFCTCDPAYKNRVLRDPTCGWCDQEGLRAAIRVAQEKP